MCGIAGILYLDGSGRAQQHQLERMTSALAHRGPDGQGYYLDPVDAACGLGHRRLAVIDPAGGAQPLANEDKTIWLTYNGEIYNFRQLRKELQSQGHTFTTACDTEVIVHLYEQVGTRCVEKLRGMFAFALWDQRQRRLLLARDRIGQKPLFYHYDGRQLLFASELKALLKVPGLARELDPAALDNYLGLGYVPAPQCIFRGFRKLPPACTLTLGAKEAGTLPRPESYWHLPEECDYAGGYDQAQEELRELLGEAAGMRTVADVPLGVLLSGGIDSSIVTALLARQGGAPLRTFNISFGDPKFNEARYARLVANRYGTEHNELHLSPSCLDVLDKTVEQFDEPFADSSAIPTYQVCGLARKHVTVALTGDGGDETFLGYHRYQALRLAQKLAGQGGVGRRILNWPIWQRLPAKRFKSPLRRFQRFAAGLSGSTGQSHLSWLSLFSEKQRAQLYTDDFGVAVGQATLAKDNPWHPSGYVEHLVDVFEQHRAEFGEVGAAGRVDTLSYLPGDILRKVDLASMAVSLECRSPFLDHEVIEFAARLPRRWKLAGLRQKRILKDAFGSMLPKAILSRGKMGFGVPLDRWFRGELRELLCDTLGSERVRSRGWFDANTVENAISEHLAGRAELSQQLWSLLALELWATRYVDV